MINVLVSFVSFFKDLVYTVLISYCHKICVVSTNFPQKKSIWTVNLLKTYEFAPRQLFKFNMKFNQKLKFYFPKFSPTSQISSAVAQTEQCHRHHAARLQGQHNSGSSRLQVSILNYIQSQLQACQKTTPSSVLLRQGVTHISPTTFIHSISQQENILEQKTKSRIRLGIHWFNFTLNLVWYPFSLFEKKLNYPSRTMKLEANLLVPKTIFTVNPTQFYQHYFNLFSNSGPEFA